MKRNPRSDAAFRHNGLLGKLSMSYQTMNAIIASPSTSHEAKMLAYDIMSKLIDLHADVRTNRNY